MKLLAIETSTEYCSVALYLSGAIIECFELVGQRHSETLMPMLDTLLVDAGVGLSQLDGIAFGKGPGSFTGVRVACGVTQGLALGADLPVYGVCTLEALAEASGRDSVIAALDARMGEIYHAAYQRRDGEWHEVCRPNLCQPMAAPALLGDDWFGAGSGFMEYGQLLVKHYAGQMMEYDHQLVPRAAAVAKLAVEPFFQGLAHDPAQAVPLYVRDKVALKTSERLK